MKNLRPIAALFSIATASLFFSCSSKEKSDATADSLYEKETKRSQDSMVKAIMAIQDRYDHNGNLKKPDTALKR